MQKYYNKKRKLNKLKTSLLLLMMVCFALPVKAQTHAFEIRMKTGTETISDNNGYNFYDSGGPYIMDPSLDPNNDYNWVTWYQHNESYLLHFINPKAGEGKGIMLTFNYLLINNDHLKIYEGDLENEANLIADLTCNDYSTNNFAGYTVTSHGNMTLRFESDYHWRDAGWEALVKLYDYAPQPPVANMQACASYVELIPGSKATGTNSVTKMYYTTDGNDPVINDPLTGAIEYVGPFELTSAPTTVKAVLVENNGEPTSASEYKFTRLITPPGAPTITRVPNTNTVIITAPAVPTDINDTYYVRYTTDNTNPTAGTESVKGDTITLTTPCTVRAVTRGTTCPDIFSLEATPLVVSTIYVPTPVITVTGTESGSGSITCSLTNATIYYTLDGTVPTTSSSLHGTGTIPLSDIAPGTTIKAMAHVENNAYQDSPVATFLFVPTNASGDPQNGVYGSVVLLDDREPHSWSYYSDNTQPVHRLKPADVKITYFGYGDNTMTSTDNSATPTTFNANVDPTQVAVNVGEAGNQFVYLKTLENAKEDGLGNYPYTLIPNPFQVRPLYNPSNVNSNANINNNGLSISNEVRDRNGNVVAQTNGTNATQNSLGVVRPIEPTRGVNTLLTEGFESSTISTTYSANGWYAYNAGDGNNWERSNSNANNGSYSARCRSARNNNNNNNCYLVSAPFTVSANMTELSVSLYEKNSSNSNSNLVRFEVFFVKASDVASITDVVSATHYDAIAPANYTNTIYAEQTRSVSSSTLAGQSVRVVVHCTSPSNNNRPYLYIDDITVTETTPNTVTAMAGTNISTAYVAAGQTFPSGTTTTTLNNVATGSYVTFQATPNDGFAFGGWYDDNRGLVSTANPYTCTVSNSLTLTAKGVPTYTVTAAAGTGISTAYVAEGTSFSGTATSVTVAEGGSATFRATVASGYGFSGWYDEQNTLVSNNLTYTANNITGNFTLTAKAGLIHTVTIASMTNGSVSASPTSAAMGGTVTLTVTPNSNYALGSLTVTGASNNTYSVSGTGSTYTFVMPDENVTVSATFFQRSNDSYRGFYAWRVKRLSSGLKIKINGTEYSSESTNIPFINAETEVEFITSKEDGNEVDFEALWAKAWVSTSTTASNLNANVTYERNFVVGDTPSASMAVPVTYSSYYPDGTFRQTSSVNGFTCGADTKFENMTISSGTFTANNHDLIMGRGLTGTATTIQGINGRFEGNLDYTLRVESGTYATMSFVRDHNNNGSHIQVTGTVHVKAILGSDYDRANNEDEKLHVSNGGTFYFSRDVEYPNSGNKDVETFNCVIKSGSYQEHQWNSTIGDSNYNLYCGPNHGTNSYPGIRNITIEGGKLANMNAGQGTTVWNNENYASWNVVNFNARIKGGTFYGSVFGGASDNPSCGSKRIVVTGGTINGWIAGGSNGFGNVTGTSQTNGNSYIYVGGNSTIGSTNPPTINGTPGGNVFGAARGLDTQLGSIIVSNVVVADSTTVYQSVYGAGYHGYISNTANVYVLGGTVKQNVYGGGYNHNQTVSNVVKIIPVTNVYVKGGTVNGSVYGGSNSSGTVTNSHVTMSGGTIGNVYGGGLGASTSIGANTEVAVSGGAINNNVYGGGELGTVTGNTEVAVSGGTMKNIFGAGKGGNTTANIGGTTTVTFSGGTIAESVYGGGENGNVKQATNPTGSKDGEEGGDRDITAVSTVNITGGNIGLNVFGGGKMGYTNGGTVVNMSGGSVEGSVFGGAFGTNGKVYVAGQRTVNLRGGTINKHVYGGSRNADDALTFSPGAFNSSTATGTASVVNMSGGYVHYQVFASGYFGNVFGSTYAFIGTNAILNAPNHVAGAAPYTPGDNPTPIYNEDYYNQHTALRIGGSVWAGGDFGNYDGSKFGDPTISGYSHVYIDGLGYDTESNNTTNTNYMSIGGSIYGSGTSCDAGKKGRDIILRNYGNIIHASQPTAAKPYSSATRALYSIQRATNLTIDNSHVVLLGEGKINSLVTTEKYTIHEFQLVRLTNGSSIFLNFPADQIRKFGSYTCPNVYADTPVYTAVPYDGLGANAGPTDNKILVNDGAYIQIKYTNADNTEEYGELEGYAHMMSDNTNNTCAYARPKQSKDEGNQIDPSYDNPLDGGFISYDASLNTFDLGTLTNNEFASVYDAPGTVEEGIQGIQMPYENHTLVTRNGEQYFRIWRAGGQKSYREGVFVAQGDGDATHYGTVDVVVSLPAFENGDCETGTPFYRIKSLDGNTTIDQGTDVMLVNGACYDDVYAEDWMYINGENVSANFVTGVDTTDATLKANGLKYLKENPNVNFGLVAIPSDGLAGSINLGTEQEPNIVHNENMLICEASDPKIATMKWYNTHNETMPKVTFRLTYNKNLTNNVVWDPMTITFEQVSCDGHTVLSTVDVALTVTTLTTIDQPFKTQAYAIVRGTGTVSDSYNAKVVLPQYVMHVNTVGEISKWTCKNVEFHPEDGFSQDNFVGGTSYLNNVTTPCNDKFGMTLKAASNFDNTIGWESWETGSMDMHGWNNPNYVFGETTARDPIAFDFTLLYDGHQRTEGNYKVGTLEFTMHFTNYEGAESGDPAYEKDLTIEIEVWFRGQGNNYYIDGVHGNNLYSGEYPNAAKKTLSGVFNRTEYVAGDNIFIVDAVTADGSNKLTWNGKAYSEVTLYRYPGGHRLVLDETGAESHWDWDEYNQSHPGNASYRGPLVKVAKNMDMTGIVLNGFYEEAKKPEGQAIGDIEGYYHTYNDNPLPNAPLIQILDGGTLSMYGASRAEFNYNSETDGGGIYVANGGVLNLYNGSAVDTNYVASGKNGGGIYVNSTSKVQLSDLVFVTGNRKGIPSAKADESVENNVYLSTYDSWVDVGTAETDDPYTQLLPESRVGITKNNDWGDYWYAPVAYSDGGQGYLRNTLTENIPTTGAIMWDDQTKYEILSLNNTHLNPPTDYVYFVGTWVTEVTENPQHPDQPNNFDLTQIDTPYELAWLISYVNGLNGASKHPEAVATLTGDIDMSANIWVPITNYTGTFNGNGHVVTGLRSPLNQEHMGMFGYTNNAHISDLVAQSNFSGGSMINVGTVIGTMNGGTLTNVEAAGTLTGTNLTENMGGLVGKTTKVGDVPTPAIHSAFAVNTISGGNNTIIGGLVGTNGGDLYNSYSNVTLGANNTATKMAGLVGVNTGTVENCYVVLPEGFDKPAFVHTNQVTVEDQTTKGNVNYCYAADGTTSYVESDASGNLTGHGTYDAVKARKAIGYLYNDNAVTAKTADTTYVRSKLTYNGKQIATWPGLLSTLNQWVKANPKNLTNLAPWFRPTSGDINGDLPVLGFPSDNSMATEDGKFLYYGSNIDANGLDNLFTVYNGKTANMFLYGNATDVTLGNGNNKLFINEDAVLLQKATDGNTPDITATVGVTFDNSCKTAPDLNGATLTYDWHFMSSPLQDATIGATYNQSTGLGGDVNIATLVDSYFPNNLPMATPSTGVKWDFYTYYEPEYHWINLKRSGDNHWHQDNNDQIHYVSGQMVDGEPMGQDQNETIFVPGKGYMMAISQDSYMNSTGKLNNDVVTIGITSLEPEDLEYNLGWNLVGNPYQAYLDLEALFEDDANTGKATQAYVYDADKKVYVPFVTDASENPVVIKYLHQHQGFFVHSEAKNATLTFKPDMATTTAAGTYFRGSEDKVNYPLVNLFVENERGNRDLAVIEFNRPELGGATKVNGVRNANFQVAASLEGHRYGLVFTPEGTEKVPVHFITEENGTFTLTWETLHGDFTSLLLVDNMTGTITDMLRADHYTFDATTDDYASRFYITYTVTGVDEYNEGDGTFAFFDGSEWIVEGKGMLDVVDVQGRTLYSERLVNDKNRVSLNGVAAGVYLLRVSDGTNTMVQKIVVK